MERWCEAAAFGPLTVYDYRPLVGQGIEIETESCTKSQVCEGKMWRLTERHNGLESFICEHMLELD